MKAVHVKLLGQIPLLAGLPENFLASLAKVCRFEHANKGDYIIEENDTSRRLFFLLNGQVRMLATNRQGQEVALAIIDGPTHFGELAVIDGYPRSAAVQATSGCDVLSIAPKDTETLIYTVPLVSQRIMQNMAGIIRKNNLHRMVLQQQNISNRLAAYLLAQVPPHMESSQTIHIKNMPTQYDLAILLGTTRESISRTLTLLDREGLIKKEGKTLHISNIQGLRNLLDAD